MKMRGFTIIELMVVIAVIAILVVITAVSYREVQVRGQDTQVATAALEFEKALIEWSSERKVSTIVPGGYGSSTAAGANGCTNGASGWVGSGSYTCTVEDSLVAAGLLSQGHVTNLPNTNTAYGHIENGRFDMMTYPCGAGRYVLYWALKAPSDKDTQSLTSATSTCGHSLSQFQAYGMRAGKTIQL